jgi:hypothetical protein
MKYLIWETVGGSIPDVVDEVATEAEAEAKALRLMGDLNFYVNDDYHAVWWERESIWPASTTRGEYDSDRDRIICADCDWYETGGPMGCGWAYHDHRAEAHDTTGGTA